MLDLGQLRVKERVRLRHPISGHNAGAIGTVVKTLTTREPDGSEVPAIVVVWDSPAQRLSRAEKPMREIFTQHEQAMHGILERAEEPVGHRQSRALW